MEVKTYMVQGSTVHWVTTLIQSMGGTGDKGWYDLWITEAYILEKNYRNLDLFLSTLYNSWF